jgi:hypothetical protein
MMHVVGEHDIPGFAMRGRTPAVVVKNDRSVDSNATIGYNILDYWDVPEIDDIITLFKYYNSL